MSMLKQIRHLLTEGNKTIVRCRKLCAAVPFKSLQARTCQDLGGLVDEVENVCINFVEGVRTSPAAPVVQISSGTGFKNMVVGSIRLRIARVFLC